MEYPSEIEKLRSVVMSMPGVVEVEAGHTPLEDFDVEHLSMVPFGDLPHAAIRRTNGGLPAEALAQIFIDLERATASWLTLEFLSWKVRDSSRAGKCVQIRTRGLPPEIGGQIQLGTSLQVIIDFFVSGLDSDPRRLLQEIEEFAHSLQSSLEIYALDWSEGAIRKKAR